MSIIFSKGNIELLLLRPLQFKRVHIMNLASGELEYSHTDCVVELENGSHAMIEIAQEMLKTGTYILKTMPTEATFNFKLSRSEESIGYLKKIVFMAFPEIKTSDVYLNNDLRLDDLAYYTRS